MPPVPVNLSKLSDVVKNNDVKKTKYDKLGKEVNAVQTSDTSDLVKKFNYNTKINEIENKILDHGHDKSITAQEFNKSTA